ncbi:MAG TPA: outer membrane protein assembly factor BamE [Kiritimatiellia bacterium]|nr:outer membrane protein assembly factor BamE [Kiritimatiellia bacterium]
MKVGIKTFACVLVLALVGCGTPAPKIKKLRLGMTPDEVRDELGKPSTIRAAKVYEDGQTQQVWEYLSGIAINPKNYWVFFENDRVVQWGEPGDFAGKSGAAVPVAEYKSIKQAR